MESPLPPDPYAALGVPKTADANTIKSTYRKLALKFHPDKVTDESKKAEATEKFHSIQQAYDIIGDEDRRAKYDAIIKLAELRRQNIELRNQAGPRVEVRTAGYDVRTAAPPYASFTTRGPTRVYTEERRPSYYDDDDLPRASRKFEFNYVPKRASPKEEKEKRERVHVSDQEKKRTERRREREADVREARDRKFKGTYVDEEFARYEAERRRRDQEEEARRKEAEARRPPPRREEYEEERKQADAKRYMASYSSRDVPRPSMFRRSSTRDSPTSGYAYTPRGTPTAEKDYFSPREPSPKAAPKRHVENVEPYERRPSTLQTQNSAPPNVPLTPQETKEPKNTRRPPHRANTTQTDFDRRKEVVDENEPPHISLPHAHTFNEFTTSTPQTAKKTEAKAPHSAPPKTAAQPDMSYNSAATPESQYFPPPPPPPQTTTTQYVYPKDAPTTPKAETSNKYATPSYRVEERAPPGSSGRRAPSPQREASSTAKKMAHLGSAGSRAHASTSRSASYAAAYPETTPSGRPSMMQQPGSSRSIPRASLSQERVSSNERRSSERVRERERERERERRYERERERDRDRGRDVERERDRYRDDRRREKLYGEMGPGYIRSTQATSGSFFEDGVSYSRRIRPEDVVYTSGGSRGSRERVERVYDERRPATLGRSSTMPVYAN